MTSTMVQRVSHLTYVQWMMALASQQLEADTLSLYPYSLSSSSTVSTIICSQQRGDPYAFDMLLDPT